jgi:hypothetical protein
MWRNVIIRRTNGDIMCHGCGNFHDALWPAVAGTFKHAYYSLRDFWFCATCCNYINERDALRTPGDYLQLNLYDGAIAYVDEILIHHTKMNPERQQ